MIYVIIAVVVLVLLGFFFVVGFNKLRKYDVGAEEALGGIDVQLTRRADLIPNLVQTVKGYAAHESGVFEEVTKARAGVSAAAAGDDVPAKAAADAALQQALVKVNAVAEAYPDLKADANFRDLQDQLAGPRTRSPSPGSTTTTRPPSSTSRSHHPVDVLLGRRRGQGAGLLRRPCRAHGCSGRGVLRFAAQLRRRSEAGTGPRSGDRRRPPWHGVLPGALAAATHDQQVAVAHLEGQRARAVRPVARPQRQPPRIADGHDRDHRVVRAPRPIVSPCQATLSRPSR